ncbi:hypothetical protein [Sediminimonas sp.]|uniref:hypothetical protein n=1 Tax=Sediminimonas sp. TaxID=2823379 RepID=UPI0025CB78F1|nr:hypothetical protein [Sediminimonas sp.]
MLRRMANFALLAALALGGVSGCSAVRDRVAAIGGGSDVRFDGNRYRAALDAPRDDRMAFTVTVSDAAGARLAGAREAGRFEATKHCIARTGSSRVVWGAGGPAAPAEALALEGGTLTMTGRCEG